MPDADQPRPKKHQAESGRAALRDGASGVCDAGEDDEDGTQHLGDLARLAVGSEADMTTLFDLERFIRDQARGGTGAAACDDEDVGALTLIIDIRRC